MSSLCGGGRRSKSYGFGKTIANLFSFSQLKTPSFRYCRSHFTSMLRTVKLKLRHLCPQRRWPTRRRAKSRVVIRRFGRSKMKDESAAAAAGGEASIRVHSLPNAQEAGRPVRIATFNAAMFSMAPAVPEVQRSSNVDPVELDIRCKTANDRPKSILKQQSFARSNLRVSINLPDNEISAKRSKQMNSTKEGYDSTRADWKGKAPVSYSFSLSAPLRGERGRESFRGSRSVLDVLREVGADIIGLQNVKAEEEKGMKPLSDLAAGLGMNYVFAESWAPEYGNAILSKWPIKHWRVQKIFDDTDFRNVLKATIEVPNAGEVNFHCTHLDHLDENWRMKQMNSILRFSDGPHILAGGLNALEETDYSAERWADIVKYNEEIGKPTPKVEVMKFLKEKHYLDAKNFAGECEAVVVVAKGQDVQGTCKYGTRVDYILASPNSPYKFVPGSYGVLSSKGTSDHHIVKVDIMIANIKENDSRCRHPKQRVIKIDKFSSKGIWGTNF
ncbi:uncharacterized protein LOC103710938 [Phoenix dactylifera]|uniref:Uncharacterized protein LOC103710938 n=1 Tax=Phoenix dactylifera TaxID=42345 RepID=A0A8B7CAK7_PHODC|nr:uncharacterized protein LOC103710938 [Phoenix dactylifera]